MSTGPNSTPVAHIERRSGENVIVICPYCGQEHEHCGTGHATAICLAGTYSIIEKFGTGRPAALPTCEHGRVDFERCPKCRERDAQIRANLKPLADEFWEYRGQRDLDHLLYRAYRMGMRHGAA